MLNKGISFGLFGGIPAWVIGLFLIGFVVYAVKMRELWGRVGILLIVIGGAGNLAQRVMYGGVVDNWNFLGLFYNNLWDYVIGAGVAIYLIQGFRYKF